MSELVNDPKLTADEASYLIACATIVQRIRPLYANDTVLTNARLKVTDVQSRYFREHPGEKERLQAQIEMSRTLGGDA